MTSASLPSIAEICRSMPAARKVFVVPRGTSVNLSRAIARHGTSWANATFATPRDLASEAAAPAFEAEWRRPLHRDTLSFWLMDRLPEIVAMPGSFFAGVSFGPSVVRSFGSTIDVLRLAGVSPDDLRRSDLRTDKKEALVALLEAYEQYLDVGNWYDEAALYDRATVAIGEQTVPAIICVLGETHLAEKQKQFIEAMPAAERFVLAPDSGYRSADSAANRLEAWNIRSIKSEPVDVRVDAIETLAPEHEIDAVLSEILRRGLSLDDVELAYASRRYLPLAVSGITRFRQPPSIESDERYDFPATFLDGRPIIQTFVGQALLGFLRWLAGEQQASDLANLALGGYLSFRNVNGAEDVYPEHLGAFLLRRRVGDGFHETLRAIDLWQAALARSRFPKQRELDRIDPLRAIVRALFSGLPTDERVRTKDLIETTASFLDRFVPATDDSDRATLKLLKEQLAQLASIEASGVLEQLAGFMLDLFERRSLPGSSAQPGQINVVPLERCGYAGRPHVFVVGLDEQSFPGAGRDDAVLLDSERRSVSATLPTASGRSRRMADAFAGSVARAPDSITFVYSGMDPVFGRELNPATALDSLLAERRIVVRKTRIGASVRRLSDSGAVLGQAGCAGFDAYSERHFPWLGAGFRATWARATNPISPYSGFIGVRTPELDVRGADKTVSPSSLERLSACPYLYFVRDVLKVRPPDSLDRRPGRWLSNLDFGNLLHELFFAFMSQLKANGEKPDRKRHSGLLEELLEDKIREYRTFVPPAGDVAFEHEMRLLQQACRVFLGSESDRDVEPIAFEAGFGGAPQETQPLHLSDSVSLRLTGSIDRVDLAKDGYEIWDYKSGRSDSFQSDLREDRLHLQWALYAYVWSDILRPADDQPVARSGYFFTSGSAYGERVYSRPPEPATFAARLAPLLEMTAEGAFPQIQLGKSTESPCRYCDYKSICATERRSPNDFTAQELFEVELPNGLVAVREWGQQ